MPKSPKKPQKPKDVETEPDAWERFERGLKQAVPPKRPKPKKDETTTTQK